MKVPGRFYLVVAVIVLFVEFYIGDVSAVVTSFNPIGASIPVGVLAVNYFLVVSTAPQSVNFRNQDDFQTKNADGAHKISKSSLRTRVVRQFGFIAPTLQTMGCLPKLFCGLNSKEPSEGTTTVNDLSYLMKFAFTNELDNDSEEKKGKDGNDDEEELSEESLMQKKKQEQMLADMADEELIYEDPGYLSYIWKDMMKQEEKAKRGSKKNRRRKHRLLNLELDHLLHTLEKDKQIVSFSPNFEKFRRLFELNRQGTSRTLPFPEQFNSTEYILSKQQELKETEDPGRKLEIAAEAGGKLRNSRQCRLLFSSCPYTVDQMKEMIKLENGTANNRPPNPYEKEASTSSKLSKPMLHINDPMHSYMTDDVYIEALDKEHHLEIENEERQKLRDKEKKKRPEISVTVPPISTYDADSQLLYLILPESQIEQQQQKEAELLAAGKPVKKNQDIEDDEASDQIIPVIQEEYTRETNKKKTKDQDEGSKESEEDDNAKESVEKEEGDEEKESVEKATEESGEQTFEEVKEKKKKKPVASKEEGHDDEVAVIKEEVAFMMRPKRPKLKYRIRNRNKNKGENDENEDELASNETKEQDEESDEKKPVRRPLMPQNLPARPSQKHKFVGRPINRNKDPLQLPPVFGEIKNEPTKGSSTSTTTKKPISSDEIEQSDEYQQFIIPQDHRPFGPLGVNTYLPGNIFNPQDDKDLTTAPPPRPIGPIRPIEHLGGGNMKVQHHRPQNSRIPPPPPIYNKSPKVTPRATPGPVRRPPPDHPIHRPHVHQRPSLLSSILNFKIVAPKKRPSNKRRRPQRPNDSEEDEQDKEPPRRHPSSGPQIGAGGIRNPLRGPNEQQQRFPPPPPIFNGHFPGKQPPPIRTHVTRPIPDMNYRPSYDVSSEEQEITDDEVGKQSEAQSLPVGPIAALGDEITQKPSKHSSEPPPPVFGVVPSDELVKNNNWKKPGKITQQPNILKDASPPDSSVETGDDGSSEEDDVNTENKYPNPQIPYSTQQANKYFEGAKPTGASPQQLKLPVTNIPESAETDDEVYSEEKGDDAGGTTKQENTNIATKHKKSPFKPYQKQHYQITKAKPSMSIANLFNEGIEKSSEENDESKFSFVPPLPPVYQGKPLNVNKYTAKPKVNGLNSTNERQRQEILHLTWNDSSEKKSNEQQQKETSDENSTEDEGNEKSEENSDENDKNKFTSNKNVAPKEKDKNEKSEENSNEEDSKENKETTTGDKNDSKETDKENSKEEDNSVETQKKNSKENSKEEDKSVETEPNTSKENSKEEDKSVETQKNTSKEKYSNHQMFSGYAEKQNSKEKVPNDDSDEDLGSEEIEQSSKKQVYIPIEIASLGNTKVSLSEEMPPPPPLNEWTPSSGNFADEVSVLSVVDTKKPHVAYMKPAGAGNLPPDRENPRPIEPPQQSTNENASPVSNLRPCSPGGQSGPSQGRPGQSNQNSGGNKKPNRNQGNKKSPENNKEKDSSEEKDSDENSDENEDNSDENSQEASAEDAVQDDQIKKSPSTFRPIRNFAETFKFPEIGNLNRKPTTARPFMGVALPPIFKWRTSNRPKNNNQRPRQPGVTRNENQNIHSHSDPNYRVYRLSLSSDESSKSASTESEAFEPDVGGIKNSFNQEEDAREEQETSVFSKKTLGNINNSPSLEIDSSTADKQREKKGESKMEISTESIYSRRNSGSSSPSKGKSERKKAQPPPLPPIYGKVGR